jgi:hypothetical protein
MVFKAIRGLLGKKQEDAPARGALTLTLEEVPEWLAGRREQAGLELTANMDRFRASFLENERILGGLVGALPAPDPGTEASPKVRSVIEKSYPQFKKAIASQIVTEFPDDPEMFYKMVTESLKGCVSALKGPGKYIHLLFPEQMKIIRDRVAEMGREVNELTRLLAGHRDVIGKIERAEEISRQIQRRQGHHEHLDSLHEDHQQRLGDLIKQVADLQAEKECMAGEPLYKDLKNLEEQVKSSIDNENQAFQEYRVMAAAALHVLRRTLKIIERKPGNEQDMQVLTGAMLALDGLEPPDLGDVEDLAGAAGRIVVKVLVSGELQLKNREERELFTDEGAMARCLAGKVEAYADARTERSAKEEKLKNDPLSMRLEECQSRLHEVQQQMAREEVHGRQIGEKQRQFEVSWPDSIAELEKILGDLAGTSACVQCK